MTCHHCADLEGEVAHLKRELGFVKDAEASAKLRATWGLTGREAEVLELLYRRAGGHVTRDHFMDSLYGGADDEPEIKIIDVYICKIRRRMGDDTISTVWGSGFAITPAGKRKYEEALSRPLPPELASAGRPERRKIKDGVHWAPKQAAILQTLSTPKSVNKVAASSGFTRENAGAYLQRMLSGGLVTRERVGTSRFVVWSLTQKGRAHVRTYRAAWGVAA